MIKGFALQQQQHKQQQQQVLEENMSNLTSASGEASASSGNRAETSATNNIYPQQYFAHPNEPPQPPAKKKRNLPGNPDPDAEVITLSPKTLMATNRFVCEICNKGFQRDQNLQLHRRGHNLPWKLKQRANKDVIRKKVYVCPEPSCVHHDPSRALGDLTGIKKHFSRKHGEKKWKCEKCSKKYAVQSDWKAHSKTCGTKEYRCDCGTLFSRRDSFITHRAFCDALAEESAKAITVATNNNHPLLFTSSAQMPPSTATSNIISHNMNLTLPSSQFNSHNIDHLHAFTMKKEQQNFSLRPDLPPWLACPPTMDGGGGAGPGPPPPPPIGHHHHHHLSSSSIFPTRLDHQEFTQASQSQNQNQNQNPNPNPNSNSNNLGPTLPAYHPTPPSPHMSATALLQKAAQMGATMSKTCSSSPATMMININRPHHTVHVSTTTVADSAATSTTAGNFGLNLSSSGGGTGGFVHSLSTANFGDKSANSGGAVGTVISSGSSSDGGGAPHHQNSLLHDMMTSLSSGTGFDHGCSSFEDAFGGIFNSKKSDFNFDTDTHSRTTITHQRTKADIEGVGHGGGGGGSGGNDGLTRDFLGLRPLSHSDFLNIAALGNSLNTTSSHEHQHQNQKSW